ncbi:hypothetical protein CBM2623_A20050 [Cupriavidus taiwanensis]|nr:hypothetical protein CBM2608_A20049 [Cupriavidus taiwanensis]SPA26954.1 hypothetical protein CBM2623_A20050 [Cupriavidus taiwanensis]
MFSLSPHGERAGVRGGLAGNHMKRGQRFFITAAPANVRPHPRPSPASGRGEQTGAG